MAIRLNELGWAKRCVVLGALAVAGVSGAAAQMPEGMGPGGGPPGAFAGGQMVRGTVTATGADKITVKTETGEVYQVALSANTRLMKARQPVKVTDVKAGDGVGAMGVLDNDTKTVHAVMVAVVDAEDVKKAREGLGKLYIAGKVTAIDEVKLTVQRTDGVSQVIEVDEGTSFKKGGRGLQNLLNGGIGGMGMGMGMGGGAGRQGGDAAGASARRGPPEGGAGGGGGESITLADVKVGDTIAGPGAVKNGVFVPSELGVMDPAAMGQRRRRPGGAAGAAGTPGSGAAGAGSTDSKTPAGQGNGATVPQ